MRRNEIDTLSPEAVARLDPVRVQEHARMMGWKLQPQLGGGQVAVYERPESHLEQVVIPPGRSLTDFSLAMARAIVQLASWENRPATELLAELLMPPADIIKVAESSPAAAAVDVPFGHGMALLSGTRKVLLAAACSVIHPRTFHPRMSSSQAEQLLDRCRLGQTERGSFVLTVACPLDAVPTASDLFDTRPYTRQVTDLLMRSLHRLSRSLDLGDADAVLREAENEGEPVISANLCEGLLEMAPEGEDSSLRIQASWSPSLPSADGSQSSSVLLRREIFPRIEYLAGRLRPAPAPSARLLVGFVETLNGRPSSENRREGQVFLRILLPDGDTVRARTELSADDYALANQAHMNTLPITLEGILRQVGRSFTIDPITSFEVVHQSEPASEGPS